MGIYDRDYARTGSARGGGAIGRPASLGPSISGMSVVRWLIIVCVAVFIIDAFCLATGRLVAVHTGDRIAQNIDTRSDKLIFPSRPAAPPGPSAANAVFKAPILLASTQQIVGEREWRFMPPLTAFGHFSTAKAFFGLEVWRFVTFQFLHANLTHLLFNMIGLWFFGPIVEEQLRMRRRFLSYYLICGICGAILYLVLNLLGGVFGLKLPGLLFDEISTSLVGASAGVFGVLMASAKIAGNATMLVFFVIPLRVSTGAYLMTAFALLNLLTGGTNAGGDAAHVGGAIAGFFFIRNMHLLKDFLDVFGPSGSARRKARSRATPSVGTTAARSAEIDAVLDKVRTQGLQSLTDREKDILRQATDERRARG